MRGFLSGPIAIVGVMLAVVSLIGYCPAAEENTAPEPEHIQIAYSPVPWSPDGRCIAFLAADGDGADVFPADWLFGSKNGDRQTKNRDDRTDAGSSSPAADDVLDSTFRRQLWIADVQSGRMDLVAQTQGVLSSPAWAADGESVVYVRFDPEIRPAESGAANPDSTGVGAAPVNGTSHGRRDQIGGELLAVRRYRTGITEVVHRETGSYPAESVRALPMLRPALSSNGLYLAIPAIRRLLVVSTADSAIIREFANSGLPSWSPADDRLVYFDRSQSRLLVADAEHRFVPRSLVDSSNPMQPVVWRRSGNAILLAGRFSDSERMHVMRSSIQLRRIEFAGAEPEIHVVEELVVNSESGESPIGAYFDYDEVEDSVFLTVVQPDRPRVIDCIQLASNYRRQSLHPLDYAPEQSIPLGVLDLSPGRDRISLRYGSPAWSAPVGTHELRSNRFRTWVPNEPSLLRALSTIAAACRSIKDIGIEDRPTGPAPPGNRSGDAGGLLDRFPIPDRDPMRDEASWLRTNRLTTHGLDLIDRSGRRPGRSAAVQRRLAEIELYLLYLRGDFRASLDVLRDLDSWRPPDETQVALELGIVRCQCLLGMGEPEFARALAGELFEERSRMLSDRQGVDDPGELSLLGILNEPTDDATAGIGDPYLERLADLRALARSDDR